MISIPKKVKSINEIKEIKYQYCKLYLDLGFAIVPLNSKKKTPNVALLQELYKNTSWKPLSKRKAALFEVENWIDNYPNLNFGLITGLISGIVVVDIDRFSNQKGERIIEISPEIKTAEVITDRGSHLYFRTNKCIKSKDISTPSGEKIGEVSGEDRYVVAPPSIHPSEDIYKWKNNIISKQNIMFYDDISFNFTNNKVKLTVSKTENHKRNLKLNTIDKKELKNDTYVNQTNKNYDRWWHDLQKNEDVAKKIMSLAGVKVEKLGKSFNCPFHKDDHPSASLYIIEKEKLEKNKHRFIAFSDFHKKGRPMWFDPNQDQKKYLKANGSKQHWFSMGEVFFAIETGKELQELAPGVKIMWWLRALDKIGKIQSLPSISSKKLPQPNDKGLYVFETKKKGKQKIKAESVEKVYEGFKFLLQLKTIYDPNQIGTTFSQRFAADWCNVSVKTARKAMSYLIKLKYIWIIKRTKGKKANILDIKR